MLLGSRSKTGIASTACRGNDIRSESSRRTTLWRLRVLPYRCRTVAYRIAPKNTCYFRTDSVLLFIGLRSIHRNGTLDLRVILIVLKYFYTRELPQKEEVRHVTGGRKGGMAETAPHKPTNREPGETQYPPPRADVQETGQGLTPYATS